MISETQRPVFCPLRFLFLPEMQIRLFIAILFCLAPTISYAQQKISCSFLNNSRLCISGTSNIVPYRLTQDFTGFLEKNLTFTATRVDNRIFLSTDKLSIPVKNFNSDNPLILPDFRKLMMCEQYPHLNINLLFIETDKENLNAGKTSGNIHVNITIAGQTRQMKIPVLATNNTGIMNISGQRKLNIRDFGLQPPVDPFGIIKVNEWIKIDFNIRLKYALIN